MRERANICKQIHMPAQSGSSAVLKRMKRPYTREAYLDLIDHIRSILPDVSLSSDFISGFCGETEEEHQETLTLLQRVRFDHAFLFAYSQRDGTVAQKRMQFFTLSFSVIYILVVFAIFLCISISHCVCAVILFLDVSCLSVSGGLFICLQLYYV